MLNFLPDYVTLAIFRGGKRQERYATPGGGRPASAPHAARTAPARPAPGGATATAPRPPVQVTEDETPF